MNKKLLAAAVAAAVVAAPAAFAESTVYGKIHTSIDAKDYETQSIDNWAVENRSSRLGFKGSEDLSHGLKAIYQIEFGIRSDGGDQQAAGDGHTTLRNTFVGLASDWGTLLAGRHDTPMKMAFYASGNERIGDSIIDLNPGANNPIGVFQEVRANNVVAYVSPNFSGFTVAAAMMPGEQSGTGAIGPGGTTVINNDLDGIADHYSLGAMYSGNGLKVSGGYEVLKDQPVSSFRPTAAAAGADNLKTWQLGASYTWNAFSFGGVYQDTSNFDWVKNDDYKAWALTGKWSFGNNALSLVYTDAKLDSAVGSPGDVDMNGWGIGAEHNFSKRTKLYAAYADGKTDPKVGSKDTDKAFSLGMIHNF